MQVLAGYDGSKESEGAVRGAARIAQAHGDPLVVIRAWELPSLLGLPVPAPAPGTQRSSASEPRRISARGARMS